MCLDALLRGIRCFIKSMDEHSRAVTGFLIRRFAAEYKKGHFFSLYEYDECNTNIKVHKKLHTKLTHPIIILKFEGLRSSLFRR